jgi:hypothetical protein
MFHDIRSLTRGTVTWFYHHHRPAFPRRDGHDTAAPLVRIYQGWSRKSTNLGHYQQGLPQHNVGLHQACGFLHALG